MRALFSVITVRHYACMVYAVVVCLPVRPSVCVSVFQKLALYQNG